MFIEDAKVKYLVYSANTVIFLHPNRECMSENYFFWSPSRILTLCSISSAFLWEIAFSQLYNDHNKYWRFFVIRGFRQMTFLQQIAFVAKNIVSHPLVQRSIHNIHIFQWSMFIQQFRSKPFINVNHCIRWSMI